jgi:ribosomal protein S12 methylthiotransferase
MLRTSFITGFPGETEQDFRALCRFVRAAEFDWMGVFAYSDVDSAGSHALDAKVDAGIIAERRDHLMSLQRPISARRLRRFVGQKLQALVGGPSAETDLVWEARLEGMAPEIDGKLYLNDIEPTAGGRAAQPGDMAMVEILESHDYDLVGRVVEIVETSRVNAGVNANALRTISTGAPLRVLA